jgi:hypothetical protein
MALTHRYREQAHSYKGMCPASKFQAQKNRIAAVFLCLQSVA